MSMYKVNYISCDSFDEDACSDKSLEHYGVLGMKWGVHKAKKKGTTYTYKSHSTKKYERKAKKAGNKGNKNKQKLYSQRAKRSSELDKRMQDMVSEVSAGQAFLEYALPTLGGIRMNAFRRSSAATGKPVTSTKNIALNVLFGTGVSYYQKSKYIRKDEKKK